jgi:hypothetical protein
MHVQILVLWGFILFIIISDLYLQKRFYSLVQKGIVLSLPVGGTRAYQSIGDDGLYQVGRSFSKT